MSTTEERAEIFAQSCLDQDRADLEDEVAPAIVTHFDSGHDGPGWYYIAQDYPDEGSVGSFETRAEAVAHAVDGGYRIELNSDDFHDRNVEAVAKLMQARAKLGLADYGCDTTRADFDAIRWLRELQKELLDAAIYCEAAIGKLEAAE